MVRVLSRRQLPEGASLVLSHEDHDSGVLRRVTSVVARRSAEVGLPLCQEAFSSLNICYTAWNMVLYRIVFGSDTIEGAIWPFDPSRGCSRSRNMTGWWKPASSVRTNASN